METRYERAPDPRPERPPRSTSTLWGAPFLLGMLTAVAGFVLLGATFFTSVVTIYFVGLMLVIGGIAEIVAAVRMRSEGGGPFWSFMLGGVLTTVVGVLTVMFPGAGLASLTLLLAGYFFASGLFHAITSVMDRYAQWGWDLAYGLISIFLGISVMARWPTSSVWLVGTLVGVAVLFRGISMMSGSLALRRGIRRVAA
ncbi:HdeD family acid-resistance protein [Corallococcus sp. BB11-1]|uniref:HdeD family acid-resistance protein n=1 Tax=Corallococcus sp. BB11-1 TaxID=2996783 RepID=UPI0010EDDA55|nr:HdeD family acid-resistance protein [Corallococcus sp. BB11-1]MCY1033097.1 HdeD family acid-resistance protein [Corallococcus sp. BB11-1]RYZ41937.1 MAG: HdeD family acid-resistance protein [Myxococcaceae bacterium]